ncbi:unnamed protein product [Rhodiola kirilowii]
MALGAKSRSTAKRTTPSYATTIIFLTLCIVAVWMLTSSSNTVIPSSQSTTTTTSRAEDTTANVDSKDTPTFEDNPGNLPEDAIKPDDDSQSAKEVVSAAAAEEEKAKPDVEKLRDQLKEDAATGLASEEQKAATANDDVSKSQSENKEEQAQVSEESTMTQSQESAEATDQTSTNVEESSEIQQQENVNSNEETATSQTEDTEQQDQASEQTSDARNAERRKSKGSKGKKHRRVKKRSQPVQEFEDGQSQADNSGSKTSSGDQESVASESGEASDGTSASEIQEVTEQNKPESKAENKTSYDNQENQESEQMEGKISEKQQVEVDSQQTTDSATSSSESQDGQQDSEKDSTEIKQGNEKVGNDSSTGGESSFSGIIPKESKESKKTWATQADQSDNEKERRSDGATPTGKDGSIYGYTWQLCNVTAGADYIPCLDNEKAIKKLRSTKHYEHRERHCPEEGPTCLVPTPEGYKRSVDWPTSRDKIWYHNVPHTKLAEVKGHQNWVKVTGEFLTFPGGGTQFIHGALHYIDFLEKAEPGIGWGKRTRVVLDVGCGVASFGGYLFEKDVLTMSFAPKDEHEAQVQFALERGIPAISAVMGSQRLPFPSRVFDLLHCARCRVPWHVEGGALLLELNRVLRPGGYFVWSATPVYQKLEEDVEIWEAMSKLTQAMCWKLVVIQKDKLNSVGAAIYRKPDSNDCYNQRKQNEPPMCKPDDDPNAAWYVPLQACMHPVPEDANERGSKWPENWPRRIQMPPYWLNKSQAGIYGKPAPDDFSTDYEHWKKVVNKLYLNGLGISWDHVRNVMDMRAVYGGFAAALRDMKIWVMNVVNVNSPDTLPIIYERGLFGIYHDWCESFSTYPRTYDLLHADHLFSKLHKRCKLGPVMAEIDRITRPGGKLIVRDDSGTVGEVDNMLKSLHWEVHLTFSKDQEGILSAQKSEWRPDTYAPADS